MRVLENLRSFREEFVTQFGDRGCSSCCSLAIGKRASERDRVSDPEGYDFQELQMRDQFGAPWKQRCVPCEYSRGPGKRPMISDHQVKGQQGQSRCSTYRTVYKGVCHSKGLGCYMVAGLVMSAEGDQYSSRCCEYVIFYCY